MALVNSTTPWRLCKSASAFFCLKLHCWPSSTLIHVLKQKEKFLINRLTWLNGCWSCDSGSSWCSCGRDAWWGCRGRGSGDRHWCRGHGCEQEPLDLAIGHGCLHELLTGPRNDRHPLRNDLQLACGLTLPLDHNRQALVPSLKSERLRLFQY